MKCHTPSFILELPLKTTSEDETVILKRLDGTRQLYNACLGEALRRLSLLRQSKEYQKARQLPKGKERTELFKTANEKYGFSEYAISKYTTKIRNSWLKTHIESSIAYTTSKRAFKAVQKKAFGVARRVRFKGKNQFDSLEGRSNRQGLIFRNRSLIWLGLVIPCIIDEKNVYQEYGLNQRIKYCRLVRRKINGRNRFYVQLILEGKPYQNPDNPIGNEEVGLDIGVGTIAYVGDKTAELKQFCAELIPDWKTKRRLARKLERSRRATNPDNYNENGTTKTGRKGKKFWTQSKRYLKTLVVLAEHERKTAAYRKSLHGELANEIIAVGCKIKTEKISYRAWQKMFGKSITVRAPSMIVSLIRRKAENAHGGYLHEIPTQTTALSQTCHKCGAKVKKPLGKRWHKCCGMDIQRDLYSAFLAKCVNEKTNVLDISRAQYLWTGLEPVLKNAMSRTELRYSEPAIGRNLVPSSFGLQRSQSGSHLKSGATIAKVADAVPQPGESCEEVIGITEPARAVDVCPPAFEVGAHPVP